MCVASTNGYRGSKNQRIVRGVNSPSKIMPSLDNYPPGLANDPSAPYNFPDFMEDDETTDLADEE